MAGDKVAKAFEAAGKIQPTRGGVASGGACKNHDGAALWAVGGSNPEPLD